MKDGGSAFPVLGERDGLVVNVTGGMSLRDWLAGQALAALVNQPSPSRDKWVAERAYKIADAMLAERGKA